MTAKNENRGAERFAMSALPWLLAGGMFAVYAATLNRWVTPASVGVIARLSGLTWEPQLNAPVFCIVTFPLRWLPAAWIPIAANLFSALCAAATLGLLARCVSLLPHDRTLEQRKKNPREPFLLKTPDAWLPPAFATLVCGWQFGFWQQAVSQTGATLDLVLFGYCVRCLLEYRLDARESWLWRAAFANGLAVADDGALVAFVPGFFVALLWIAAADYLNPKFLAKLIRKKFRAIKWPPPMRILACWLAGFSLFFLLPVIASCSQARLSFWQALSIEVASHRLILEAFRSNAVLLLCLTSVVPLTFMGIRWKSTFGVFNDWTQRLSRVIFQSIHAFFLVVCLLVALGAPFSSRQSQPALSCLPLYFLGALCIGYYTGYFLLLFGPNPEKSRRRRSSSQARLLRHAVFVLTWALVLCVPALMLHKNLPDILRQKNSALAQYFDVLQQSLPPKGAAIFSHDSLRLEFLEARLVSSGKQSDYLLVDGSLLASDPGYAEFLSRKHPDFKIPQPAAGFSTLTNSVSLVLWLKQLSTTHDLYLMHPFSGLLMELFYPQQRGLLLQLQPCPTNDSRMPILSQASADENRAIWKTIEEEQFPPLLHQLEKTERRPPRSASERLRGIFHPGAEPDAADSLACVYYSLQLNTWGVELQRLGSLGEAGKCFEEARRLNPENNAAEINLQCNRDLQSHKKLVVDPVLSAEDNFGVHRNWDQSLRLDGPTDEPNTCFRLGTLFAAARMMRQSVRQFERVEALAPNDTNAPMRLADMYLMLGEYTNSFAASQHALEIAPGNPRALFMEAWALIHQLKFYQAIPALDEALEIDANNSDARLLRAMAYLNVNKLLAAREDYQRALTIVPNAFPAYYGLARIAHQRKEPADTIKNCELYLSHAPSNTTETAEVKAWLEESKKMQIKD